MTDQIEQLEAKVAKLEQALLRLLKTDASSKESIDRSIKGLLEFDDERRQDTADLYQRLKQIELHLFPGIDKDIQRVYRITKSETPPRHNPLDVKRPKKV